MSLDPIKPETITYHSPLMDITNGCIPFESHFMIMSCNPFSWAKHQEYPVFKPNDYFWTHHQKAGESKPDTYCRVIRELMGE